MMPKDEKKEDTKSIGLVGVNLTSFIVLGKFITILLTGIAFIVVTRILGPSIYGVYTLAIGIMGIISAFGNFGVSTALNKFISEFRHKKEEDKIWPLIFNSFAILILISIVIVIITLLLSNYLAANIMHNKNYGYIIDFAALSVMFIIIYDSCYGMIIGFGNGKYISYLAIIEALIQSVTSIVLALLGFEALAPILGLIMGMSISSLFAFYIISKKLKIKMRIEFSIKEIKRIFKFSMPVGVSHFFAGISGNIGLIILGIFTTTTIVGNYGITTKIGSFVDIILGSIFLASVSIFSIALASKKISKEIDKLYNYSIYVAFLIMTPILLYISVLSLPFSYTVFSGFYKLAPLYIELASIGILISIFGSYAQTLLISAGRSMDILKYGFISFIIQIVSIAILVPKFGGIGLVVSIFYITYISQGILFVKRVEDTMGIRLEFKKLSKLIAANIIVVLLLLPGTYFLKGVNIPLLILSAIIVLVFYPPALVKSGALLKEDIDRLKRVMKGIPIANIFGDLILRYASYFM